MDANPRVDVLRSILIRLSLLLWQSNGGARQRFHT
jgi:hypothetical protein